MASFLALRRAASSSSGLFLRFAGQLRPPCYAPSVVRSFSSSAQIKHQDEDEDDDMSDDDVDVGFRQGNRSVPRVPAFFPDVVVPFMPTGRLLSLMDQLRENGDLAAALRGVGTVPRRGCEAKEDEEALHLRMDMPGLGKEHVKVSVEENTLMIKGEGPEEEEGRRYTSRIDLRSKVFKVDEIKAEMKNGVLEVVVPKIKQEERKDVFHVQVD